MPSELLYRYTGCRQLLSRQQWLPLDSAALQVQMEKAALAGLAAPSSWARQAARWAAGDSTSGRAVAWKHPRAWAAVRHQHADPA